MLKLGYWWFVFPLSFFIWWKNHCRGRAIWWWWWGGVINCSVLSSFSFIAFAAHLPCFSSRVFLRREIWAQARSRIEDLPNPTTTWGKKRLKYQITLPHQPFISHTHTSPNHQKDYHSSQAEIHPRHCRPCFKRPRRPQRQRKTSHHSQSLGNGVHHSQEQGS